ncbi:YebC/PmpR family DNA-binding transcriptional regulator [Candidatus Parcubacteria bacterium]|nr:MAG: YebC/PmpR family DNA-binding transcriptional regulator [Candidatus Parcubacteria bacterium]
MSGHSKWAQIHRQKGAADAKKGAIFTKLANNISLAAKLGGGNPDGNFKLKLAIDQARAANMPKDNIERAIKRGTGELAGGEIVELRYEGFGPGGIAVIIDCLTDNRNRTAGEIKHLFNQYGGSLGSPNSVAWQFASKGVIRIKKSNDEKTQLDAIEAGAEDIVPEDEYFVIATDPKNLQAVKTNLEKMGYTIEYAETEMVAKEKAEIKDNENLKNFFNALDDHPDVNNYYSNAKEN